MKLSNEDLIKKYRETNDEKYVKELYDQNRAIPFLVLNEYPKLKPFFRKEKYDNECDLEYVYDISFMRSLKAFNFECGLKFSTLLSRVVRSELGKIIQWRNTHTNKFNSNVLSTDKFLTLTKDSVLKDIDFDNLFNGENYNQNDEYFSNIEQIKETLIRLMDSVKINKRERLAKYCIYFIKGYSTTDIGRIEGISKQAVDQFIRRCITKEFKDKLIENGLSV